MKTLDFCLTHSPQSISKFVQISKWSNRVGRAGPAGRVVQARCADSGFPVMENDE
jgi:hypothetical protein